MCTHVGVHTYTGTEGCVYKNLRDGGNHVRKYKKMHAASTSAILKTALSLNSSNNTGRPVSLSAILLRDNTRLLEQEWKRAGSFSFKHFLTVKCYQRSPLSHLSFLFAGYFLKKIWTVFLCHIGHSISVSVALQSVQSWSNISIATPAATLWERDAVVCLSICCCYITSESEWVCRWVTDRVFV